MSRLCTHHRLFAYSFGRFHNIVTKQPFLNVNLRFCSTTRNEQTEQKTNNHEKANDANDANVANDGNQQQLQNENEPTSNDPQEQPTKEQIEKQNEKLPHNEQILTEGFSQEEIPEPPAAGKTLFRDAVIAAIIAMIGGAAWTVYSTKKESYDDATLNQVNTVRAHITHAMNATNSDARIYHLQQAEFHCRKALDEAGGGYLAKSNQSQSMDVTQIGTDNSDCTHGNKENGGVSETGVPTPGQIFEQHSRSAQKLAARQEKMRKAKGDIIDPIKYDPAIVALHLQLGRISYMLRKYQAGVDNFLVVLKALSQEFGYESEELIMPCRQISECYMYLSQYTMAKLFLERSLAVIDNETSNPQYGPICEQMAVLLRKEGDWNESILYSKRAYEGGKTLLGDNHIQMAHILLGRACAELEIGNLTDCEQCSREALKIVDFQSGLAGNYKDGSGGSVINSVGATRVLNEKMIEKEKIEGVGTFGKIKNKMLSTAGIDLNNSKNAIENEKMKEMNDKINQTQEIVSFESNEIIDIKCGILFVYGQCLIEQVRYEEAEMILATAMDYAQKLNDQTKLLLIYDQVRDLKSLQTKSKE